MALARRDDRIALHAHAGILHDDGVDDRRDVARKIGEADPVDAVAGAAVVDDGFPLEESRARSFNGAAGFRIRAEPARPFLAGIFGVAGAHEKFQARLARGACGFCASGSRWRRTPPVDASPLRKKLRVEGARFVGAFGFVLGADGENFSGIRGAQEDFAGGIARDAGDLRGAGFGELRENAVAIDGQQRAVVAGAGEKAAIGSESERVDDVVAGSPKFFRRAFGGEPIDAAGKSGRKRDEGCSVALVPRQPSDASSAAREGGGSLRRGDDGGGGRRDGGCFSPMAAT